MTEVKSRKKLKISRTKDNNIVKGIRYEKRADPVVFSLDDHPFINHLNEDSENGLRKIEITVSIAELILSKFNNRNRELKSTRFKEYAIQMKRGIKKRNEAKLGEWINSNITTPISFYGKASAGFYGNLSTGQHRLAAQIMANKSVTYWASFDDTDCTRIAADAAGMKESEVTCISLGLDQDVVTAYRNAGKFWGLIENKRFDTKSVISSIRDRLTKTVKHPEISGNLGWDEGDALDVIDKYCQSIPHKSEPNRCPDRVWPVGVLPYAFLHITKNHSVMMAKQFIRSCYLSKNTEFTPEAEFDNPAFRDLISSIKFIDNNCTGGVMDSRYKVASKAAKVAIFLQALDNHELNEELEPVCCVASSVADFF